jgi:hypothetical protein
MDGGGACLLGEAPIAAIRWPCGGDRNSDSSNLVPLAATLALDGLA